MIKFYTAVGRYVLRKDDQGIQYPLVIAGDRECALDIQEMIIWSSLLWKIRTYDELKADYSKQAVSAHVCLEAPFDSYIHRLLQRGLIVSGSDYVGIDALYALLSRLYIIPITDSFTAKLGAFINLTFQGVPFRITSKIFKKEKLTANEEEVLYIARQQMMSTAELIRCVQLGESDVDTEDKLVDVLYSDADTTGDNIHIASRFEDVQPPVLRAVSNLYLKKMILFEKAV